MKKIAPLLLVALPFIGLFDAGYVSYEIFSERIPVCLPPFQCATFLQNEWAYIAGLPLSVYGIVFYIIFLILAILNFLQIKDFTQILKKLAIFGLGFALYVSFIMGSVVKAWCLWCLVSAINLSLIFITSLFLSKPDPQPQTPTGTQS